MLFDYYPGEVVASGAIEESFLLLLVFFFLNKQAKQWVLIMSQMKQWVLEVI